MTMQEPTLSLPTSLLIATKNCGGIDDFFNFIVQQKHRRENFSFYGDAGNDRLRL
jgi:hypothetical protein